MMSALVRPANRLWSLLFAGLPLLLVAPLLAATDAEEGDELWRRLAGQDQAQGRFHQELYDEGGALMERSAGRYAVMKPGYFRWEITEPDRQEIVVADGVLWHYDIDLATVSRREVDGEGAFTALDLLARDTEDLADRFDVERLAEGRFRLLPRFGGAAFSAVEVTWDGDALVEMQVRQRGGQRLALSLSPDIDAAPLERTDFRFEVPEGLDPQAEADF